MHEHKEEQKKNFEEMINLINNSHNQIPDVIAENFKFQHGANQFRFVEGLIRGLISTDTSYLANNELIRYIEVLRNSFIEANVHNEIKFNTVILHEYTIIFESVRMFSKDNRLEIMRFMERFNCKLDGFSGKSYTLKISAVKRISDELIKFIDNLELRSFITIKVIEREHILLKRFLLNDRYVSHSVKIDGLWK